MITTNKTFFAEKFACFERDNKLHAYTYSDYILIPHYSGVNFNFTTRIKYCATHL